MFYYIYFIVNDLSINIIYIIFTYFLYYLTISSCPILMENACKFCLNLQRLCNILDEVIRLSYYRKSHIPTI